MGQFVITFREFWFWLPRIGQYRFMGHRVLLYITWLGIGIAYYFRRD